MTQPLFFLLPSKWSWSCHFWTMLEAKCWGCQNRTVTIGFNELTIFLISSLTGPQCMGTKVASIWIQVHSQSLSGSTFATLKLLCWQDPRMKIQGKGCCVQWWIFTEMGPWVFQATCREQQCHLRGLRWVFIFCKQINNWHQEGAEWTGKEDPSARVPLLLHPECFPGLSRRDPLVIRPSLYHRHQNALTMGLFVFM